MRSISAYIKMTLAVLMVLASSGMCVLRLMKVQVVNTETYNHTGTIENVYTQKIPATRGEIVDANQTPLVGNHVTYAVVIDKKNFPTDNGESNSILLRLAEILDEYGIQWADTLPVSKMSPYNFQKDVEEEKLSKMKQKIGVNDYATAANCMDVLCDNYGISDSYKPRQKRIIAGIRYTMLDDDFSLSNQFRLAQGLNLESVTKISELSFQLQGVSIQELAEREIFVGDVIPHELGTTGPIYAENAEEYLAMGYDLDATVGISGIEKAMEGELQGNDGIRTMTFENGVAVSDEITDPVQAGHTVQLTIDSDFQRGLQEILDNFLDNFHYINTSYDEDGNILDCGALVVLDAKTGAILGEVTAPTYDLTLYSENYDELVKEKGNPLFNRATMGLYRPGSTFKTITATAGLNEGIVTGETTFYCGGVYRYMDTDFHCTGTHNMIAVARALRVSCNSYFYELARRLTIDKLIEYADYYGIGQNTGIETRDAVGYMATPEKYREIGLEWTVGSVLQAGIGNGDTMVTPLQLACVANTIANEGIRYKPYLVDSVWDYGMTECIKKTEPTILAEIPIKEKGVYDYVENGMIQASGNGFPAKYSLTNLGYDVAIKTGTPQVTNRVQDSVFLGYAPADDPKIAFAGIVEGGEYSKYMIRSILKLYEEIYGDMT